jgi:hypothetical protein
MVPDPSLSISERGVRRGIGGRQDKDEEEMRKSMVKERRKREGREQGI